MSFAKTQTHLVPQGFVLGIDLGTSGIRAVIVNYENHVVYETSLSMALPHRQENTSEQDALVWTDALERLFSRLHSETDVTKIKHIIADATSSTLLLVDSKSAPLTIGLMYDDKRATEPAEMIRSIAPSESAAHGVSSSLAKVLWLRNQLSPLNKANFQICHQIDWVNQFLTGKHTATDMNNALKLGYDVIEQKWPEWMQALGSLPLPTIVTPGTVIGTISAELCQQYGFCRDVTIHAGTTDSIAAFLASGADQIGDAVTSLGSTLSVKLLSNTPIFNPDYGVYSHRLGDFWLVGGASNTGGAVLLSYFSLAEIKSLLSSMTITQETRLNYYPLLSKGERFPIADKELQPKIDPIPESKSLFLMALIEGLVNIEKLSYQTLAALGAPQINHLFAAGGGTQNTIWMALRKQNLGFKIKKAAHNDAAFGVTQLVLKSNHFTKVTRPLQF